MALFLGVDTSCYMTSVAVVDQDERLVVARRQGLTVGAGNLGLRQSEAVFQHVRNLPLCLDGLAECLRPAESGAIAAVAASTRPRNTTGSYMPVFAAGESFGRSVAGLLGVPFISSDHQSGHLLAGAWSAGLTPAGETLAVHLSGGTTEFLRLRWLDSGRPGAAVEVQLLGGTTDLAAGQFVDRAGVALGLPFPAGPHLERLAVAGSEQVEGDGAGALQRIPSSVNGYSVSFSGPAAAAERLIGHGAPPAVVARSVFGCVANTLEKVLRHAVTDTGVRKILIVGGVAANSLIRRRLRDRLQHRAVGAEVFFAAPEYSGDNAVGVALAATRLAAGGFPAVQSE